MGRLPGRAPPTIPVGVSAVEAKSLCDRVRRVEIDIHGETRIEARGGRSNDITSQRVLSIGALGGEDQGAHRVAQRGDAVVCVDLGLILLGVRFLHSRVNG